MVACAPERRDLFRVSTGCCRCIAGAASAAAVASWRAGSRALGWSIHHARFPAQVPSPLSAQNQIELASQVEKFNETGLRDTETRSVGAQCPSTIFEIDKSPGSPASAAASVWPVGAAALFPPSRRRPPLASHTMPPRMLPSFPAGLPTYSLASVIIRCRRRQPGKRRRQHHRRHHTSRPRVLLLLPQHCLTPIMSAAASWPESNWWQLLLWREHCKVGWRAGASKALEALHWRCGCWCCHRRCGCLCAHPTSGS